MSGNRNLWILFGVLAVAAAVLFWTRRAPAPDGWESTFGYDEVERVDRIHMLDKLGNEMWLRRTDEGWTVNGEHPARQHLVDQALEAIAIMEPDKPVGSAAHDTEVKAIMASSTFVEVFAGGDDPVRQYHVGGASVDGRRTMVLRQRGTEAASRPYEVKLPGFKGSFSARFMVDPVAWRSRDVFAFTPEEIERIAIDYIDDDSLASFSLDLDRGELTIADRIIPMEFLDQAAVVAYAQHFRSLTLEAYENDFANRDSVEWNQRYTTVTVTVDGRDHVAELFHMQINERSKAAYFGRPLPEWDPDRYWALINDGRDWVMVQHYVWGSALLDPYALIAPQQ